MLSAVASPAAFEEIPVGARALALCNATCGCPGTFALCANPAALVSDTSLSLATYATQLYGEDELTFVCGEVHFGYLGIFASSFGGDLYREDVFSFGGGLSAQGVSLGASLKAMALSVSGYGSTVVTGVDVGVIALASGKVTIAALGKNLNFPSITSAKDEVPPVVKLGIAAVLSSRTVLSVDIAREPQRGLNVSMGHTSAVDEHLSLRAGLSTNPAAFSGGFGVLMGRLSLDYSVMMHRPLGLTHGVGVCYTLARR